MTDTNIAVPSPSAPAPTSRWTVTAVWAALILSIILDVKVPLGDSGRFINLSAFDVVVPACLFAAWALGGIGRPPLPILSALGATALLVLSHSGGSLWLNSAVEPLGLARETVKLVAVCTLLAMLITLFTAPTLRVPPAWLVVLLILAVSVDALRQRFDELRGVGGQYAETLDANTIVGLLVLLIATLARTPNRRATAAAMMAAVSVSVMLIFMFTKIYLAISVAAVIFMGAYLFIGTEQMGWGWTIGVLLLSAILGLAIVYGIVLFAHADFVYFPIASIEHSLSIRLALWEFAWRLSLDSFPWGTGLGQFGALISESPELRSLELRYVHNTALALLTELGALGLLGVVGLGYLTYRSCRPWPVPVALAWLAFLVLPFTLHDSLGMRMTILVLAYGVSESLVYGGRRWVHRASAENGLRIPGPRT